MNLWQTEFWNTGSEKPRQEQCRHQTQYLIWLGFPGLNGLRPCTGLGSSNVLCVMAALIVNVYAEKDILQRNKPVFGRVAKKTHCHKPNSPGRCRRKRHQGSKKRRHKTLHTMSFFCWYWWVECSFTSCWLAGRKARVDRISALSTFQPGGKKARNP